MQQVIANLVQNAIEAMDTATDQRSGATVGTKLRDSDAIIVTVEDSGPGIDPTKSDEIFEAFATTKADGMGLALAICRMIIQNHGGELSMLSDGTNGASFRFTLPINHARFESFPRFPPDAKRVKDLASKNDLSPPLREAQDQNRKTG